VSKSLACLLGCLAIHGLLYVSSAVAADVQTAKGNPTKEKLTSKTVVITPSPKRCFDESLKTGPCIWNKEDYAKQQGQIKKIDEDFKKVSDTLQSRLEKLETEIQRVRSDFETSKKATVKNPTNSGGQGPEREIWYMSLTALVILFSALVFFIWRNWNKEENRNSDNDKKSHSPLLDKDKDTSVDRNDIGSNVDVTEPRKSSTLEKIEPIPEQGQHHLDDASDDEADTGNPQNIHSTTGQNQALTHKSGLESLHSAKVRTLNITNEFNLLVQLININGSKKYLAAAMCTKFVIYFNKLLTDASANAESVDVCDFFTRELAKLGDHELLLQVGSKTALHKNFPDRWQALLVWGASEDYGFLFPRLNGETTADHLSAFFDAQEQLLPIKKCVYPAIINVRKLGDLAEWDTDLTTLILQKAVIERGKIDV
jgi:hypothetical protein